MPGFGTGGPPGAGGEARGTESAVRTEGELGGIAETIEFRETVFLAPTRVRRRSSPRSRGAVPFPASERHCGAPGTDGSSRSRCEEAAGAVRGDAPPKLHPGRLEANPQSVETSLSDRQLLESEVRKGRPSLGESRMPIERWSPSGALPAVVSGWAGRARGATIRPPAGLAGHNN